MTVEALLIWILVGLVAGWLASRIVGDSRSTLGDILVGILGAFLGGQLFRFLGWRVPFKGVLGTITVAVIGAVVLLLVLRLLLGISQRRR